MDRTITVRGVLIAVALVLLIVGGSLGGFFFGQGTRKSDSQVHGERVAAVTSAVSRKGAQDKVLRERIMDRQERKLKRHQRKVVRRVVAKLKKSGDRKAAAALSNGYSSGRSEGYNDGESDGREQGLVEGSDQLSCSDDPDVVWLPGCSY